MLNKSAWLSCSQASSQYRQNRHTPCAAIKTAGTYVPRVGIELLKSVVKPSRLTDQQSYYPALPKGVSSG